MTKVKMMIALLALSVAGACGTVKGVASDTYGAGKFVVRQISGD